MSALYFLCERIKRLSFTAQDHTEVLTVSQDTTVEALKALPRSIHWNPNYYCLHYCNTIQVLQKFSARSNRPTVIKMNCNHLLATLLIVSQMSLLSFAAKCTFYGSSTPTTGETTASGETFNPIALTCTALPHIPMGKVLEVTNQRNGRSITVRVNDRFGMPPQEDALDLTYGAFGLLDSHEVGEIPCSYTIL